MKPERMNRGEWLMEETSAANPSFMSVLKAGFDTGLLDEQELEDVQTALGLMAEKIIRNYIYGDSSSVKVETAASIFQSVSYVLDAGIASYEDPIKRISVLSEKGIEDLYERGMEVIENCVEESTLLFREVSANQLHVPLEIYNDTINIALPAFFDTYDADFAAHDTVSSMDYPLVFDDMTMEGIFYIKHYLETLKIETEFCHCFGPGSVLRVLDAYGQKHGLDFACTPVNLFEILFDQAVFSVLTGHEEVSLTISKLEFELFVAKILDNNPPSLHKLIDQAVITMIQSLTIQNPELIDYMKKAQQLFASRFVQAYENGNLANMLIIEGALGEGKLVFEDGQKMNNEDFIELVDQLQECEEGDLKIQIIATRVHSMEDYMDLLGADCVFGDEFSKVFRILGDVELAVLGKNIFYEELRCGPVCLRPETLKNYEKNIDSEWTGYYIEYILQLEEDRRQAIEDLMKKIVTNTDI